MFNYLSAQQIATNYDYCITTARTLIAEVREQADKGRYPAEAVLDGCGVRVNESVLVDYLKNRKALKDPVACRFVPQYGKEEER